MFTERPIENLAIFGCSPTFGEKLHVGRPNIGGRAALLARIEDLLDRRWLTNNGRFVQQFELELSKFLGVEHCIAVCNATVGLEIAIKAAGLEGEVIVPSFTFVATAHALQWQGITPVFCDVDPKTHNIDPRRVDELITPRTTGILGVHLWGRACDVDALADTAQRHGLKLLFDAAHAFGSSSGERMIGGFGDAEVFSFHATKFFNTFEGGAIATNDDDLAAKIRLMKNFGFAGHDEVVYLGTNGKMNEVCAAMGLTSMESIDEFVAVNRSNYERYREGLVDVPGVDLVSYPEDDRHNYQYIVVDVDEGIARIGRDALVKVLWAENVVARRYFYPGSHCMEPYRSLYPHAGMMLPVTEDLTGRLLTLPTGTSVGPDEISKICQIIRLAVGRGPEIRRLLASRQTDGKAG